MTRRGYVAGVLAALLAAATVVAALAGLARLLTEDEDQVVTGFDDYYRVAGDLTCDSTVREVPVVPLEVEPVAMLVCADPDGSMPWTAPAELVEGDLGGIVDALAGMEPAPIAPYDCTFQGGPAYDLLLRFSRDRVARVHGDTAGCGVVRTATGDWFGAQQVLDVVLDHVESERAAGSPPAVVEPLELSCDRLLDQHGTAESLTGDPTEVVRLVSCWRPDAGRLGDWREAQVPSRDVELLARDLEGASADGDAADLRCPGGPRRLYFQALLGQTVWGDLVLVRGECRRFLTELSSGGPSPVWHPSPRAQRILDRLRRPPLPS